MKKRLMFLAALTLCLCLVALGGSAMADRERYSVNIANFDS